MIYTLNLFLIILYKDAIVRGIVRYAVVMATTRTLPRYAYQQVNKWQSSFICSHLKHTLCVDHVIALVVLGLYKY